MSTERALLGAILTDPSCLHKVRGRLTPSSFEDKELGVIWSGIQALDADKDTIDVVSVAGKLANMGLLTLAGGVSAVSSLLDAGGDPAAIDSYCKLVQEQETRRKMSQSADALKAALAANKNPWEALARHQATIEQITSCRVDGRLMDTMAILDATNAWVDKAISLGGRMPGVTTGFDNLDEMTGGMQKSDVWVVAARPGVGKSAAMVNLAQAACAKGAGVAVFSLEMSAVQVGMRFQSMEGGVQLQRLRFGTLNEQEAEALADSRSRMSRWRLWLDDSSGLTVAEIRARCLQIKSRGPLDVVIIDYIQIMTMAGGDNRQGQISQAMMGLKAMAKDLGVCVVVLSQLSRQHEKENRKPTMADLKESGGIEENADLIIMLHREDDTALHVCEWIIAKQRNGPTGELMMGWNASMATFVPMMPVIEEPVIEEAT